MRSGTLRHPEVEFFGRFDREPMAVDRDRLGWFAAATWWRPPGAWIFNDPDHQTEALRLAAACLEVFDGMAPMQERRQALLSLHTRHMEEATASADDPTGKRGDLEKRWAAGAADTELSGSEPRGIHPHDDIVLSA